MPADNNRRGIISVGNWVVDTIKFIDRYPTKGNLTTIARVNEGLGGCAHNVLVDLAKLRSGIPLYAGGCIGNDDNGRMCLDACVCNGIDASNMHILDGESTSYTDVMTETYGGAARTFFHHRGANARLGVDEVLSCDTPAKIFHLGYLLLLDSLDAPDQEYGVAAARALRGLREKGYKTSVDVVSEEGDRYRQVILPCLKYTDYLIINEVELGYCVGRGMRDEDGLIDVAAVSTAARELLDAGVGNLVIIHYPEGSVVAERDGRTVSMPSYSPSKEDIVSTVGAGDAFCAGALYAIHENYPLEDLLKFASASARFNLFSSTSTDGAPDVETIRQYYQKNG